MILCTDVDYHDDGTAHAAGVVLQDWRARSPYDEAVVHVKDVAEYVPGQFYKRELPCILRVMRVLPSVGMVIVDGYTWLEPGRKGLGAHLWDALGGTIPVIGVAKAYFKNTKAIEVCRGKSKRPLYVTAQGIDEVVAAEQISRMHGRHRFPEMLKRVDHLCRGRMKSQV